MLLEEVRAETNQEIEFLCFLLIKTLIYFKEDFPFHRIEKKKKTWTPQMNNSEKVKVGMLSIVFTII